MIKKTETIQVRLTNYGTIDVVSIPTRIYKDSYKVMKLSCVVPKVEEVGARICKVYATDVDETGNNIFTSNTHFLPSLRDENGFEKIINVNGFDYVVYEDYLPEEFCKNTGNVTLNFSEGIIDDNNEYIRVNVSGQLNLFVNGDGYNYAGVKISNYDVVASRVNEIYDIAENALEKAQEAVDSVVESEGTKIKINGEFVGVWNADFVESEKLKSEQKGDIVHRNEEPIVFAESERQKSKNLFNVFGNYNNGHISGTANYSVDDTGKITVNNDYAASHIKGWSIKVKPNVVYSLQCEVETTGSELALYVMHMTSTTTYSILLDEDLYGGLYKGTFVVPPDVNSIILGFGTRGGISAIVKNVQIEEGAVATDYQPYNGAIVHEKQLNEAVEKRDLLYRQRGSVNIVSSSLDTLKKYYDLFENSPETIYYCDIGSLVDSNFRTLVGTPTGFGGYAGCFIKKVVDGFSNGHFGCYELHCVYSFSNKIAKSYIFMNANNDIKFSGWTVIGG